MDLSNDTIVARATAPGRAGIGIIRISGSRCLCVVDKLILQSCSKSVKNQNRKATLAKFVDENNTVIDQGLVLYFAGPYSFTGEDVIELHAHGGVVLLDWLLQRCIDSGARLANPGEFSLRAFLNNKIDLVQAEAIADLIDSSSRQAVRNAASSLQGFFSNEIESLVESIVEIRVQVEAQIDFVDESIETLEQSKIRFQIERALGSLRMILRSANQGCVLQEGLRVAIVGRPNAGKSSLLNCLAGQNRAIVTEYAGTTRDVLREKILLGDLPIEILDTAGLRETNDPIEREGISRALQSINECDLVLLIFDAAQTDPEQEIKNITKYFDEIDKALDERKVILIENKIDLLGKQPQMVQQDNWRVVSLSAKQVLGIPYLIRSVYEYAGIVETGENQYTARRRHLQSLEQAESYLKQCFENFFNISLELIAEDLKLVQKELNVITGKFTADDLLGKIFSKFCIGK